MSNRKHAMWNCRLSNMPEEGNMEINIFKVLKMEEYNLRLDS